MSATNPGGFIPEHTEGDLVYRLNFNGSTSSRPSYQFRYPVYQNEHPLHPFIPAPFPRFQITISMFSERTIVMNSSAWIRKLEKINPKARRS